MNLMEVDLHTPEQLESYEIRLSLETVASMLSATQYTQGLHILEELLLAAATDDVFLDAESMLVADLLLSCPSLVAGLQDAVRCPGSHLPLALTVLCHIAQQATDPHASFVLCANFLKPILRVALSELAANPRWPGLTTVVDFFLAVCCEQAGLIATKGYLPLLMAWSVKCAEASHPAFSPALSLLLNLFTDSDVTDIATCEPATLNVSAHQFLMYGKWLEGLLGLPVCIAHRVRNVVHALHHAVKRIIQHMERGACSRAKALVPTLAPTPIRNVHAVVVPDERVPMQSESAGAPTSTPNPIPTSTPSPAPAFIPAPILVPVVVADTIANGCAPWTPSSKLSSTIMPTLNPSTPTRHRRCPDVTLSPRHAHSPRANASPCAAQKRKGSLTTPEMEREKHVKLECPCVA